MMKSQRRGIRIGTAMAACVLAWMSGSASAARHDIKEICGACRVEKFSSCGGFLEGASVDKNGTLWAVDLLGGKILSFDKGGVCSVQATGIAPNGAKFHKDGRLFITDKDRGILAFDPATKQITTIVDHYKSEHLRGTNDLVFDARGGLYFTEPYGSSVLEPNGRVFYLPPEPKAALQVFAQGIAYPNGIALSPDETLVYVGEFDAKQVLAVPSLSATNPFETAFVFTRLEGGTGPDGMAVDSEGNLYSAAFKGREIYVADAAGFAYGSIVLPPEAGTFVTNMAFYQGDLVITEASKGEIWRVKINKTGHPLFHQR